MKAKTFINFLIISVIIIVLGMPLMGMAVKPALQVPAPQVQVVPIDWSAVLQNILLALLVPLFAWLAAMLKSYLQLLWAKFKATQPTLAQELETAAGIAVPAAEQAGIAAKIKGITINKLSYATNIAQNYLLHKGLTINLVLIEGVIEKAVKSADYPHAIPAGSITPPVVKTLPPLAQSVAPAPAPLIV